MAVAATVEQRLLDALSRYERAADAGPRAELVAARAALCALLEASGMELPPEVRDQMWRDQKVLRELDEQRVAAVSGLIRVPSHRPADSVRPTA